MLRGKDRDVLFPEMVLVVTGMMEHGRLQVYFPRALEAMEACSWRWAAKVVSVSLTYTWARCSLYGWLL